MTQPMGTPLVSVASDHFHPVLPRSVGFGPVPSPAAGRLVQRAVDRDVGEVEPDHLVEGTDGFFDQAREGAGGHPLVAPAPQGGLAPFAEAPGHVPTAPGDQAEQDGLEAVAVREAGPVTAQRMVGFSLFGQVGGKRRPDGIDDDGVECKHGTSTGSLGWDDSRIMSVRAQQPVDLSPGERWSTPAATRR